MRYTPTDFRATLRTIGMTQEEFAMLTGMTPHAVMQWKHRTKGVPPWARSWLLMWRTTTRETRDGIRAGMRGS